MAEPNSIIAARSEALHTALSLPISGAVYEVVRHNEWASGLDPIYSIPFVKLEAKGSRAKLDDWRQRSLKLRRDAYKVGDAGLRGDGSYDSVGARFVSENPGFGDVSYESAIRFEYQQAR